MKASRRGIDLIRSFEGLRLSAYQDTGGVWTIGYGHTGNVKKGDKIDEPGAIALLADDLSRFEVGVMPLVKVPLTQGQFDALVSFSFNLGLGALSKSTLLKKLNSGDYEGAQKEFARWIYDNGRMLPGLVKRRAAEAALFGESK